MNSQELMFRLGAVSSTLQAPMFDALAKDGKITKGEIDSTRERLKDIVTTLNKTTFNKIEAMLAQYGAQLDEHFEKFESVWTRDYSAALQEVQIMLGFMTSILAKSGIKEA
jgi:DNA anti-recombination protein RmuC